MRIRDEFGSILESHNDFVIDQWKKKGYIELVEETSEDVEEVKPKKRTRRKTDE